MPSEPNNGLLSPEVVLDDDEGIVVALAVCLVQGFKIPKLPGFGGCAMRREAFEQRKHATIDKTITNNGQERGTEMRDRVCLGT